jgi:Trp operon repressor
MRKIKKGARKINTLFGILPEIPPVSSFNTRKEWEAAMRRAMDLYFLKSPAKAARLFLILTTPQERRDFMLRMAIADRLIKGMSYRHINYEIGVYGQKISEVKKAADKMKYVGYYERSKTERKKKPVFKSFKTESGSMRRPHQTKYGKVYW